MGNSNASNKHVLKDILSSLMEECDIDDSQLARETGVPASTISRMRINSNSNPTASTLRPISKYFSISISQLLGDEPLPKDRLPGHQNPSQFTSARMPVINWDNVFSWITNDLNFMSEIQCKWISTEKDVGPKSFALLVNTDTYGLVLKKGSMIIIDPDLPPEDGNFILLSTNDNKLLLRKILVDGNDVYTKSLNPEIKNIKNLQENEKIIGVIIETRFSIFEQKDPSSQKIDSFRTPIFSGILTTKPI